MVLEVGDGPVVDLEDEAVMSVEINVEALEWENLMEKSRLTSLEGQFREAIST